MKLNKVNKFLAALCLVAVIFAEIDARRPGLYGENPPVSLGNRPSVTPTVPSIGPAGVSTPLTGSRGRGGKHHRRRKGTVCRRRTGCSSVKVRGTVSAAGKSKAVVCKGNVCRRAVVSKPGVRRGYGRRGHRRGHGRRLGQGAPARPVSSRVK